MVRFLCAGAALVIAISAGSAWAQQDVITGRRDLMKRSGQQMGVVNRMVRGQDPFDAAKVTAAYEVWTDKAQKLATSFPDTSRTGDTRALASIWDDRAGFDAQIAQFAKDVSDTRVQAIADIDGLKAALPVLLKDCNSCHEKYRRPQS